MVGSSEIWQDILEWDVHNWKKAVDFWEQHVCWPSFPATALEVGARHGGLSLFLALKGFQVVCSDLGIPGETARHLHGKYSVTEQISYRALDATQLDCAAETFDVVVFKSILGGIGRPGQAHLKQRAIQEIYRVLKPGGYLLFGENLQATRWHQWLRQHFVPWSVYWGYVTVAEMHQLLSPFRQVHSNSYGVLGLLGRQEWQRQWLGWLDDQIESWLNKDQRYLICGVAQK